ncbi:hypothetical protein PAXRUDRAFT_453170 [Paxillus rubicundulus Ve08.2h10]|uniref:Uncharacterized protein n=1 Tax=Paxillus rubicundulus Ve08.2h10 TaxID=930991 RepID=A0A0D0ECP7_9AGAM|nr:hypothetical protein PAXRUDRAFT_453170 [Paxillus rubicundulus Ve08.2h10]
MAELTSWKEQPQPADSTRIRNGSSNLLNLIVFLDLVRVCACLPKDEEPKYLNKHEFISPTPSLCCYRLMVPQAPRTCSKRACRPSSVFLVCHSPPSGLRFKRRDVSASDSA